MNDMMLSPLTMSMSGAKILFEQKKFEHKFYGFLIVWSVNFNFMFMTSPSLINFNYSLYSTVYTVTCTAKPQVQNTMN